MSTDARALGSVPPLNPRSATVCDCAECGALVDITAFAGFDPTGKDVEAEHCCDQCGKIVCRHCYEDLTTFDDGDQNSPDYVRVCASCTEKRARPAALAKT